MGTTITSTTDLVSAAETAAKKNNASDVASSSSTSSTSSSGTDALSSLTSNYNQFLSLLTAQLQHQDPTSPMDDSSFTSELAQFAGVEQQITTNTNLTQLLSLNQDSEVSQGTSLVGRQAVVSSTQLPLQNGSAELQLNPTSSGSAEIAITNSAGTVVRTQAVNLTAGTSTSWTWDGKDDSGNTLADGSYDAAVVTGTAGTTVSVPFDVLGTITGVTKNSTNGIDVQMGTTTVDMSKVTSLLGAQTTTTTTATSTGTGTTGSSS